MDLAETFLICPTCLCHFDRSQRRPKLLVCSHSFCLICINEMVKMPQSRQTGSFCCPVCRQPIVIPIDGADGFPPSFMVNQLIDLISTQPKQAISKCPTHLKELLFCEDCDRVFCPQCAAPPDHQAPLDCGVSVMPLSLATKKFSAILTLKAHNSIRTLIEADRNVCKELSQLERNMNTTKEQIFGYFKDLAVLLQERQENLLDDLRFEYE